MDRELLAKLERYLQTGYTPDLRQQAVEEIKALHRAVLRYRWERLAGAGLVVCYLQSEPWNKPTRTHRTSVHDKNCRHVPDTRAGTRNDDKLWKVHRATGTSLAEAIRVGADICKVCRPNVDVYGVID